jgi:hypothetical protein
METVWRIGFEEGDSREMVGSLVSGMTIYSAPGGSMGNYFLECAGPHSSFVQLGPSFRMWSGKLIVAFTFAMSEQTDIVGVDPGWLLSLTATNGAIWQVWAEAIQGNTTQVYLLDPAGGSLASQTYTPSYNQFYRAIVTCDYSIPQISFVMAVGSGYGNAGQAFPPDGHPFTPSIIPVGDLVLSVGQPNIHGQRVHTLDNIEVCFDTSPDDRISGFGPPMQGLRSGLMSSAQQRWP